MLWFSEGLAFKATRNVQHLLSGGPTAHGVRLAIALQSCTALAGAPTCSNTFCTVATLQASITAGQTSDLGLADTSQHS